MLKTASVAVKTGYSSLMGLASRSMLSPVFAQMVIQSKADLKGAVGSLGGIIIIISWLAALVGFITGMIKREADPSGSKNAFMFAAGIAMAGPVVGVIFYLFFGSGGTPTPSFG